MTLCFPLGLYIVSQVRGEHALLGLDSAGLSDLMGAWALGRQETRDLAPGMVQRFWQC